MEKWKTKSRFPTFPPPRFLSLLKNKTARRAGFALRRGTGTISAATATSGEARLLAMRAGDPLLVEQRVIVDGHARRIESTESRYPADRYGLVVDFDVERPEKAD